MGRIVGPADGRAAPVHLLLWGCQVVGSSQVWMYALWQLECDRALLNFHAQLASPQGGEVKAFFSGWWRGNFKMNTTPVYPSLSSQGHK